MWRLRQSRQKSDWQMASSTNSFNRTLLSESLSSSGRAWSVRFLLIVFLTLDSGDLSGDKYEAAFPPKNPLNHTKKRWS